MDEIEPLVLQIEVTYIMTLYYKRNLKSFEEPFELIIKPYLKKREYFDVIGLVRNNICNKIRVQHSTDIRRLGSKGFIPDIIGKRISEVNKKSILRSFSCII